MGILNSIGIGSRRRLCAAGANAQFVVVQQPLRRVLAFRGRTIDDVVNNPIVKNEIFGYWKVLRQIEKRSEVLELERQWNRLGQRV